MRNAKFPRQKDLATFDYGAAVVTRTRIKPFYSGQFIEEAHSLILVGGTGTKKPHIGIALGTALINNGRKVRYFNAVDPVNALDLMRKHALPGRGSRNRPRATSEKSSGNC